MTDGRTDTVRVVFEAEASGVGEVRQVVSTTLPFPLSLTSPFPFSLRFQTNQWEGRSDPVRGKFPAFSPTNTTLGMARVLKRFHSFTCTPTHSSATAIRNRNRNEPYLPLPSQPQLVLIYRPRRDGRMVRSSPGRDLNLQPPDCKSGTPPHSH